MLAQKLSQVSLAARFPVRGLELTHDTRVNRRRGIFATRWTRLLEPSLNAKSPKITLVEAFSSKMMTCFERGRHTLRQLYTLCGNDACVLFGTAGKIRTCVCVCVCRRVVRATTQRARRKIQFTMWVGEPFRTTFFFHRCGHYSSAYYCSYFLPVFGIVDKYNESSLLPSGTER